MARVTKEEGKRLAKHDKEPVLDPSNYTASLAVALNHYRLDLDDKKIRLLVDKFGKQHNIKTSSIPIAYLSTIAGVCRLHERSQPLAEKDIGNIIHMLNSLSVRFDSQPKPTISKKEPAKKPADDIFVEQVRDVIGELEGELDNLLIKESGGSDFDPKTFFKQKYCTAKVLSEVAKHFSQVLDLYTEIKETSNLDLKEAYSNISRRKMNHLVSFLERVVSEAKTGAVVAKAIRKPRAKKQKPASVLVSKLQYMKEWNDFKSCEPQRIIDATEVVLFNTKTRKLSIVRAVPGLGLSVKGTSIINADPEKSVQKTLRKPEQQLQLFVNSTKVHNRKNFESIKATEAVPSNRVNLDMIIVSIIK